MSQAPYHDDRSQKEWALIFIGSLVIGVVASVIIVLGVNLFVSQYTGVNIIESLRGANIAPQVQRAMLLFVVLLFTALAIAITSCVKAFFRD